MAVATLFAIAACNGGSGDDELRPAEEARADAAADASTAAEVGESFDFGVLTVTIQSFKANGDDTGPWLEAAVRVENASGEESMVPEFGLVCAGSDEVGGWQADSTLSMGESLPPKSFEEGMFSLLIPGDGRYGDPVPECATPAVVQVTSYVGGVDPVRVPVPDDVIMSLAQ